MFLLRNGVLKEGETVSIEGLVMFLNCYRESLLLVRQQKVAVDDRGKQKVQAFDVPSCAKEPHLGKRDAEEVEACLQGVRTGSRWLNWGLGCVSGVGFLTVIKMLKEGIDHLLAVEREKSCLKKVEFAQIGRERNKVAQAARTRP
ncbi:hypothetical protein HU200_023803 [Digitaria exilis]|uniref:Uncharacterized protein n=1 Tax=Digitaria exilis TaxID=1010633 RepID=A0A835BZP3_9POAL|nr:hypothetical protein HU200_023803 [Digitaria exilis]